MSDTRQEIDEWNESTLIENHICRICLSISNLQIPIFKGEGLEQELYGKIKKYLPLNISPSDGLPQQVCYHCAGTIVAWNSLYTLCVKTDEKLQLLSKAEKEKILGERENNPGEEPEPLMPPKKKKVAEENDEKLDSSKIENLRPKGLSSPNKIKKSKNESIDKQENNEGNTNSIREEHTNSVVQDNLNVTVKLECESEQDEVGCDKDISFKDKILKASLIKCEFCIKTFKDKKCLNKHVKRWHEKKSLEVQRCDVCGNVYKTKTNLERHYWKEHVTDQVTCPVCSSSFNSKKLDSHLKSAHGVKNEKKENDERFKCKMCEKKFKNKYARNSHVKEVHLSEPIKCNLCDFEGTRKVLRRHKRDVHAEKRFACSLCPGAFKTLHTLNMHMTSHSDVRCYTCDICGMGFKRLNNVRDHMKCHEQKSNQCQICGNFFARKRYLAIHEKTIHNFYADGIVPEDKGFECGTCGAKLKWKKNLLAHMRRHTGEKPYVCKICNKNFICHGSLRTHMAKHSVCYNDATSQSSNLPLEVNVFSNFAAEQS